MLKIESLAALDGMNDKMHDMRSTPRGENGITGRRYYKGNINHMYHAQAFTAGREQASRQLAFRHSLRKHHGVAEQHKHQTAEDRRAYSRLKNELVQRHEQPALA